MLRVYFIAILSTYLFGCAASDNISSIELRPQVIESVSFPPIPPGLFGPEVILVAKMLISEEGKVVKASFLSRTFDPEWDSLAVLQLLKWKFLPAKFEGKPVSVWVRQSIKIQIREIQNLMLSEIVCESKEKADSIYTLLKSGENFAGLAKKISISSSSEKGGSLGETDIRLFPYFIQKELLALEDGKFTKPLYYRTNYYIFRRVPLVQ